MLEASTETSASILRKFETASTRVKAMTKLVMVKELVSRKPFVDKQHVS